MNVGAPEKIPHGASAVCDIRATNVGIMRKVYLSGRFYRLGQVMANPVRCKLRRLADRVDLDAKTIGYAATVFRIGLVKMTALAHLNKARRRL